VPTGTHTDARWAALAGLIDHAPLFPPASMTMADALAEDARVRTGAEAWLVGRFVVPLTRLDELGGAELPLSVVLDADPDERLADPRVEAAEVPPGRSPDALERHGLDVYVERPLEALDWLDELSAGGLRAKVRCGGRSVPGVEQLAAFVRRCRELSLPFKATAGLHQPIRGESEHGFLNLLAAAAFGDEEAALADGDAAAFGLTSDRFSWRGHTADAGELARIRRELFVGFGSCSAREPAEHLKSLGILTA
jgi:hypothetical protein